MEHLLLLVCGEAVSAKMKKEVENKSFKKWRSQLQNMCLKYGFVAKSDRNEERQVYFASMKEFDDTYWTDKRTCKCEENHWRVISKCQFYCSYLYAIMKIPADDNDYSAYITKHLSKIDIALGFVFTFQIFLMFGRC